MWEDTLQNQHNSGVFSCCCHLVEAGPTAVLSRLWHFLAWSFRLVNGKLIA